MTRLHLFRNLRTLAYLVVVGSLAAGIGFLWWANQTGLPTAWRAGIEHELAKQGIHATLGSLSFNPFRGIIAKDVTLFSDPDRTQEFCRLEQILIDVDKTKIARGVVNLTKIQVSDASLSLRIQPQHAAAETLEISGLHGTLLMPGGRLIELRDARGTVAGIEMVLGARLLKYREGSGPAREDPNKEGRLLLMCQILKELKNWQFDRAAPPTLRCFVDGDLSDSASIVARLALTAKGIEKNRHVIDRVTADGNLSGSLFTLTTVRATDSHGVFEGRVDYDIYGREGRFDLTSSVNLPQLLKAWFGVPLNDEVVFGGGQELEAEGEFQLKADAPPQVRMTGRAHCAAVKLRGVEFDGLEAAFSWGDDALYLRDVVLARPDGKATGKAMIQWPLVRIEVKTNLPIPIYRPFFVAHPLDPVLHDFGERPKAAVQVALEGGFDTSDKDSWAFTGGGRVANVTYKGVPVDMAQCEFSLSHRELDFTNGTAVFNYQDYPLRKAHAGPTSSTLEVGRIRYDAPSKTVIVENVTGTAWAAPVVRTFAPPIADTLEIYGFHQPPRLTASGVVDVTPQGRTALDVTFRTPEPADYVFLGKPITLQHPSGKVAIRGDTVVIDDLKAGAFEGPIEARIRVGERQRITFEANWSDLSMQALNDTYRLNMKGGGQLTGRLELAFTQDKVETMSGTGLAALEDSVLFSAPIAGPLSSVIATVLDNQRVGFEQAKDAFLTFTIKDGILHTRDFHTSTKSLVFAADGWVDLSKLVLDANVRVNARGLLGLVTLPLRPFSGLFQFRGTGPLSSPEWNNAPFSPPPPEQQEVLAIPPRAEEVTPPPPKARRVKGK
jgi:hypothetical protein